MEIRCLLRANTAVLLALALPSTAWFGAPIADKAGVHSPWFMQDQDLYKMAMTDK